MDELPPPSEELLSEVRAVLEEWASGSPFLAMLELSQRVHVLPLDFPAAAVGAALVGAPDDIPAAIGID